MAFELNKIDIKILNLLQKDARISDKEISRKIHLSSNAVSVRISRLEEEGYIEQYVTILNKARVNRNFECFTGINLTENNYQTVTLFERYIDNIPEIYRVYRINSTFDFLLHIVTVDIQNYHHLFVNELATISCVKSVTPLIVLNEAPGFNIIDLSHI